MKSNSILFKYIVLSFFILLVSNSIFSQKQQTLKFSRLSLEEGLSQSVVFQTLQDKDGLLWFGTQDGLNKYDGYKFTVYRNNPKDDQSLSNNSVLSILEDSTENLWIGTHWGGLNQFNKRTEKFTVFKNAPRNPESISNNSVYTLLQDRLGYIWIGTDGGGLNRFDKQTGKFKAFRNDPLDEHSLSNNTVYKIIEDEFENLWVGTFGGGLNKFDKKSQTFTVYKNDPDNPNSLSNNYIYSILKDKSGIFWIGTNGGGLNRFDSKSGKFTVYVNDANDPKSISNNIVYSVLDCSSNSLWVATYGGGLNKFDKNSGKFTTFKKDPLKPESLSSNYLLSLYEDRSKTLWVGTYGGGLSKFNKYNSKFSVLRNDPLDSKSLSSNAIRSIFIDKSGILWIGTRGGGLNRYNKEADSFIAYKNNPNDFQSLSNNAVYSIFEDKSGILWIGTYGGGLNRFNKNTGKFLVYKNDPNNRESLSSNSIYSVFEDSSGDLWVGTDGGGLNRFNRKTGKFTVYMNNPKDSISLSSNTVLTIHEDKDGALWIGTRGGGLNKFNKQTEKFLSIKNDPSNPYSLPNNSVQSIVEDDNGRLWIGTDGGGLHLLINEKENSKSEKKERAVNDIRFVTYSIEDGLPNNCIYGIVNDRKGNLWLSTNKGICKFTPANYLEKTNESSNLVNKPSIRNYDYYDGLPSNEFNTGAYYWKNGIVYFGSISGLLIFNPDSVENNPYEPSVVITGFQLFNREVGILQNDKSNNNDLNHSKLFYQNGIYSIPQSITYTKELTLSYDDKVFTFEFASLDFAVPGKNQFAYKMEGFDNEWNNIGTRRYATYTNLSHGEYNFHVIGSNSDGVWNEKGVSIKLIILPPFWQTLWFRILSGVIFVGLIVVYIMWRERKLKWDKEILEATVKERTIQLNDANEELNQQNEEISSQRDNLQLYITELTQKNDEILAQRDEIQRKNIIIEQKNTNITASITYAENIQQSILPDISSIKAVFPDSFVLYKPKDIVSGDFFWLYEMEKIVFFAVVDCTGHGVPGALMSVLGFTFLRKALHDSKTLSPSSILDNLSLEINNALKKTDKNPYVKDGMDLALCAFHKDTLILEYAGVHNSMYLLRNNIITKFKPDNHPIGDPFTETFKNYTNKVFQLERGDSLYLFTDGHIDQFGGPKNQKFSSKQFESIVINNSNKPMNEIGLILDESLNHWQNGYEKKFEQTDDITIMAIRI